MNITTQRPRGLVPGSQDWLVEVQGPKLVMRLIKEIEAQKIGQMSATGARLLGMALDRILPSLTAIHHTGDGQLNAFTDDQLKEKLRILLGEKEAARFDMKEVQTVDFQEGKE
jgi:hypothetical protein